MFGRKVLVLNQNYEPITICSMQRAVVLLILEKVQLIEQYPCQVHSVSFSMPCPSVIRLKQYVSRPYKEVVLNRKNILRRDKHICQYCGRNSQPMTIDHVIPKSYGGKDTWENLVCACLRCNHLKGNRTPEEAGMKLLKKPVKPSHLFFLQTYANNPPDSWKPYLFLD